MQFAVGDMDEGRDIATQIQQGVQFDGRLCGAEQDPGKDRKTQIDGRDIKRVNGVVEFETQVFLGIQRSCDADQGFDFVNRRSDRGQSVCIQDRGTQTAILNPFSEKPLACKGYCN